VSKAVGKIPKIGAVDFLRNMLFSQILLLLLAGIGHNKHMYPYQQILILAISLKSVDMCGIKPTGWMIGTF